MSSESVHHFSDNNKNIKLIASRRSSLGTGLPSPNSSFSSLSSFASNPSSRNAPRTPPTPLRSAVLPTSPITPKARPSPLFRLLHSPSPIPPPTMTLHQPTPHYSQPPSPTNSSTSPNRPPSRSERLLRDTLRKDEVDRNTAIVPLPPSPLVSARHLVSPSISSPSPKEHRRRHSHVPPSSLGTTAHEQQLREREEYTRGSILFRTAMTNARPPSPSPSVASGSHQHHQQYHSVVYGGGVEASVPSTPQRTHKNTAPPGTPSRRGVSPASNSRSISKCSPPRKASHSPSPVRPRPGLQHRPSPLLLDPTAPPTPAPEFQRRQSLQGYPDLHQQESPSQRPQSRREPPTPPSRGEPLVMTPHEQVLRARLERVLNAGRKERERDSERRRQRDRSQSSQSNEVRDEEGGWPWRGMERDRDAAVGLRSLESVLSSPMELSDSNSSSPSLQQDASPSLSRARSKTDAAALTRVDAPSPRRRTTAPSAVATARNGRMQHTGTTPPLVPDGSPILGPSTASPADMEDVDGELRLLTPPPTPPYTFIDYNAGTRGANGVEGYFPSPYKTSDTFIVSRKGRPLGSARRPTTAPRGRYPSPSRERNHVELDEHDETSSCSSSQSYQHSSFSSTFANNNSDAAIPCSPPVASFGHHSLQFNARKASAQCRAMNGYVSFASVEGLGVPPDDPRGDGINDRHAMGGDLDRGRKASGVLAWGFRKLLGGVVGANENTQHHQKESVVL